MKLRNKKTGEVGELVCNLRCLIYIDDKPKYEYKTLYSINKEWKDYKQAELCGEEEE